MVRKNRTIPDRKFQHVLTPAIYGGAIRSVLLAEFGNRRHGPEMIARLANATPRAARNWLEGLCAPQGAALLNLMAQCEAVDLEMQRLKKMARGEGA